MAPDVPSLGPVPRRPLSEVPVPEPVDTTEEAAETPTAEEPLVEESLVEEVSIDGMCGVY